MCAARVQVALWGFRNGYGSVMLQSGELVTENRLDFVCDAIKAIRDLSVAEARARGGGPPADDRRMASGADPDRTLGLGVAISLGELPTEYYQRLFAAGAHRYLLRIETSNPALYARIHPDDGRHMWSHRYECMKVGAAGDGGARCCGHTRLSVCLLR